MEFSDGEKSPPTGGGKESIAPVVPLGYRPAWDGYRDAHGRSQQVKDDAYFYVDSLGRRRAFRLSQLYTRATITDLYGANIPAIRELWPGARRGQTFSAWEVARWIMAAACSAGIIDPTEEGFALDKKGHWVLVANSTRAKVP